MDRHELEYNAILEQVTREASLQAERDLRAGRNFPAGNILNRLDIQARLGSRVAPIEERILEIFSCPTCRWLCPGYSVMFTVIYCTVKLFCP